MKDMACSLINCELMIKQTRQTKGTKLVNMIKLNIYNKIICSENILGNSTYNTEHTPFIIGLVT